MTTDLAFEAWKARAADADILSVAQTSPVSAKLKKHGREWTGPCPNCLSDKGAASDRFSVNPVKRVFNCRGSGGGDVITMVMHACRVGFTQACEIINREPPPTGGTSVSDEELKAQHEAHEAERGQLELKRQADEKVFREAERGKAYGMWERRTSIACTAAEAYLALRGIDVLPVGLRAGFISSMPYYDSGKNSAEVIHRGPCLLMPIVGSAHVADRPAGDRTFAGVHLTFIDLGKPKGKIEIVEDPETGALYKSKKIRGTKQGGHIVIVPHKDPRRLIIGEGVEKVLAVWRALVGLDRDLSDAAFWTSVDLDNLGGDALKPPLLHPTKRTKNNRPTNVAGPAPDMAGTAISVPDSVEDILILGDSSSDRFLTQCTVARAAARWAKPGRNIRVAWSPDDADFDDLLRQAA